MRRYGARIVVSLTWDEEGVTECAFVTRAFWRGEAIDQVQLHLRGGRGQDVLLAWRIYLRRRGGGFFPPCRWLGRGHVSDRDRLLRP